MQTSVTLKKVFLAIFYFKLIAGTDFERPEEPMLLLPGLIVLGAYIVVALVVAIGFLQDAFDIIAAIFVMMLLFSLMFVLYRRLVLSRYHAVLVHREISLENALGRKFLGTKQTLAEKILSLGLSISIGYKASFLRFSSRRSESAITLRLNDGNPWARPSL